MNEYMEFAIDQRVNDAAVAKQWVFDQIENNRASFVQSVAEVLANGDVPSKALTALSERFEEWVEDHPKTQELAAELREEAAEAKREAEEETEMLAGWGCGHV
jgi:flagellar biosynthesis/type III secretory pathway protein FliH